MGVRGAPAPGHRCCVVDLSSFFFPVDQWGKETTGRRPSGEQSTPSLCSLCGLRRHYLTRPRVSSAPHTPAFRNGSCGPSRRDAGRSPLDGMPSSHLCVFLSAWSTFPLAQMLPPGAPSLTSSGTMTPRHPRAPHHPAPPTPRCLHIVHGFSTEVKCASFDSHFTSAISGAT